MLYKTEQTPAASPFQNRISSATFWSGFSAHFIVISSAPEYTARVTELTAATRHSLCPLGIHSDSPSAHLMD